MPRQEIATRRWSAQCCGKTQTSVKADPVCARPPCLWAPVTLKRLSTGDMSAAGCENHPGGRCFLGTRRAMLFRAARAAPMSPVLDQASFQVAPLGTKQDRSHLRKSVPRPSRHLGGIGQGTIELAN